MKIVSKIVNYTDSMRELIIIYLVTVISCSVLFTVFEPIPFTDSIWMSFVTSMTVGYGDFYPVTLGGRLVAGFLMHFAPLFLIPLITSKILSGMIEDKDRFTNMEQESILRDIKDIKKALIK